MKVGKGLIIVAMGLLSAGSAWAQSPEDPVLALMVKKGLVTQAEADQAKAEQKQEAENAPSSSLIQLQDKSVQKLVFYGDGRLRFENIDQHNHYNAFYLNDRERYRLRLGADYYYSDNLKAGVELESGTTDDSANQTFGGTFTKASLNVGKIYLQYQPVDWLTAVAGKFSNPWYTTTDMVYSFDLNPEGGAELLNFNIPLGGGDGIVSSQDPKDMKQVVTSAPSDSYLNIGLNAVQYLYVNSNESTITPGINNNDVLIIGNQIPITWKINKDLLVKVAPGFTFYTGGGNTNFDTGIPTNTGSPSAQTTGGASATSVLGTANSTADPVFYSPREADDLAILSAPGEFNFNIGKVPIRPYWDFEYNVEGHERIQNVYLNPTGTTASTAYGTGVTAKAAGQNKDLNDDIAWAAGVQIGSNKKKGDFSLLGEFRQIGLGAVDQNINSTDFGDSYANQEGFKLAGAYNFTDFLTLTTTFYDTWDYKSNLYKSLGGLSTSTSNSATSASTLNLVSEKASQRVQVDLGWKF